MKKLLFGILLIGMCGCAARYYAKPNMTQEEFNRDAYECKQQALAGSMNNVFIARDLQDQCMRARGYTQTTKPQ